MKKLLSILLVILFVFNLASQTKSKATELCMDEVHLVADDAEFVDAWVVTDQKGNFIEYAAYDDNSVVKYTKYFFIEDFDEKLQFVKYITVHEKKLNEISETLNINRATLDYILYSKQLMDGSKTPIEFEEYMQDATTRNSDSKSSAVLEEIYQYIGIKNLGIYLISVFGLTIIILFVRAYHKFNKDKNKQTIKRDSS